MKRVASILSLAMCVGCVSQNVNHGVARVTHISSERLDAQTTSILEELDSNGFVVQELTNATDHIISVSGRGITGKITADSMGYSWRLETHGIWPGRAGQVDRIRDIVVRDFP
ncbi:MAG: hypothetical protein PF692_02075 [Kiritimatiellae bacterium]|jgi:hypothetical protein|nr:hypothetical protein [Kiritimatiellia bacterium]